MKPNPHLEKRGGVTTLYRLTIAPNTFTRDQIVKEARAEDVNSDSVHSNDLLQLLLAFYGYWFQLPLKLFAKGSRNLIRLRLFVIAIVDPIYAAKVVLKEWTGELRYTVVRNRSRRWQDDEFLSCIYEAWSTAGTQGLIAILGDALERVENNSERELLLSAIALLNEDLKQQEAMYMLVGVPGVTKSADGHSNVGKSPCMVRAACLRGGLGNQMMKSPATTPGSVGWFGGATKHTPLPFMIQETSVNRTENHSLVRNPIGSRHWKMVVDECVSILSRVQTFIEFNVRHYLPHDDYTYGTKFTSLIGHKDVSSTGEIRGVMCSSDVDYKRCDVELVTAHIKQRKVPPSTGDYTLGNEYYCESKDNSDGIPMPDPKLLALNATFYRDKPGIFLR